MKTVNFTRTCVIVSSGKSFEQVTNTVESMIGKSDDTVFGKLLESNKSFEQVKTAVEPMVGKSGFMIFVQVEQNPLLYLGGKYKKIKLHVFGSTLR